MLECGFVSMFLSRCLLTSSPLCIECLLMTTIWTCGHRIVTALAFWNQNNLSSLRNILYLPYHQRTFSPPGVDCGVFSDFYAAFLMPTGEQKIPLFQNIKIGLAGASYHIWQKHLFNRDHFNLNQCHLRLDPIEQIFPANTIG